MQLVVLVHREELGLVLRMDVKVGDGCSMPSVNKLNQNKTTLRGDSSLRSQRQRVPSAEEDQMRFLLRGDISTLVTWVTYLLQHRCGA